MRRMATLVNDACSITDASCQPEKEDSNTNLRTSSKRNETLSPNQNHPTNTDSWNGSLPLAVPTNPAGPGFHYVESSTTDSGVSNASSVTSDSIPITQCTAGEVGAPPSSAELHRLDLRTVETALRSSGIEDVGECDRGTCVSSLPGTDSGLEGEKGRREKEGKTEGGGIVSGGLRKGECVYRVAVCNGVYDKNNIALFTPTLTENGSNVHNQNVCLRYCVWPEL